MEILIQDQNIMGVESIIVKEGTNLNTDPSTNQFFVDDEEYLDTTGKPIQRLIGRINIEDNESFYYLQKSLRNMGVDSKLREMGVCEGDTVILDDWELEWYD